MNICKIIPNFVIGYARDGNLIVKGMEELNQAQGATESAAQQPASGKEAAKKLDAKWRIAIIIGAVLAAVAWIAMLLNEYVSFWSAIVSLACSIVGAIKAGKGMWRDLAITAAVCSGALTLVYIIFYFGINYALDAI